MLSYNHAIYSILERRFEPAQLHGYYGGVMNADHTKLMAYTYVRLDAIELSDRWSVLLGKGCSAINVDIALQKNEVDENGHYTMKNAQECIEQGIYTAYVIRFIGILYEGEWYVSDELIFFGDTMDEDAVKGHFERRELTADVWDDAIFQPPVSETGYRDIDMEVFERMPWLAGHLQLERKTTVKRAFSQYVNTAIVRPFFERLRIEAFDAYSLFIPLTAEYLLVFPESRAYFLVVAMVEDGSKGFRLLWFFYDMVSARFYRWTYPVPRFSEDIYGYSEEIIEDLRSVSNWDDMGFLRSSRTMDDATFWSEYVLLREAGRYVWLEEIG